MKSVYGNSSNIVFLGKTWIFRNSKEVKSFLCIHPQQTNYNLAFLFPQQKIKSSGAYTLTALNEFFAYSNDLFEEWVMLLMFSVKQLFKYSILEEDLRQMILMKWNHGEYQ